MRSDMESTVTKCCEMCQNQKAGPSVGWLSPKNVWFPNVVMIRLRRDCACCARTPEASHLPVAAVDG